MCANIYLSYMKIHTNRVVKLLANFGEKLKNKPPLLEDGNLDVNKLQTLPETIQLIKDLKKEGLASSKDLNKLGLPAAAMILRF